MALDCDLFDVNFKRYRNILFPPKLLLIVPENGKLLNELKINIGLNKVCPGFPETNEDESCKL